LDDHFPGLQCHRLRLLVFSTFVANSHDSLNAALGRAITRSP
jgi:hypothetical protein